MTPNGYGVRGRRPLLGRLEALSRTIDGAATRAFIAHQRKAAGEHAGAAAAGDEAWRMLKRVRPEADRVARALALTSTRRRPRERPMPDPRPRFYDVPAGTRPVGHRGPATGATMPWVTTPYGSRVPADCAVDGGRTPKAAKQRDQADLSAPRGIADVHDGRGAANPDHTRCGASARPLAGAVPRPRRPARARPRRRARR